MSAFFHLNCFCFQTISNEKETSYLELSASASFISSADNSTVCNPALLYAHSSVSPGPEAPTGFTIDAMSTSMSPPFDSSPYEVEIDASVISNAIPSSDRAPIASSLDQRQLSVNAHSSCPELAQITQILSLNDNQVNCNYVQKLIMMNTNVVASRNSFLPESFSFTSSQPPYYHHDRTYLHRLHQPQVSGLSIASTTTPTDTAACVHCLPRHHRMLKSVSQVEPLSLIEKVREVRDAVQKTLNCQFKFPTIRPGSHAPIDLSGPIDRPAPSSVSSSTFNHLHGPQHPAHVDTVSWPPIEAHSVNLHSKPDTKSYRPRAESIGRISIAHRRRRTKSLGLLQLTGAPLSVGVDVDTGQVISLTSSSASSAHRPPTLGNSLSLIQQPMLLHRPGSRLISGRSNTNGRGVFSSSPSIKCDIVEYL